MSADDASDWAGLLAALPTPVSGRKLRLWCVAWSRIVLREAATPIFDGVRGWFTPAAVEAFHRSVDAAEEFADGRTSKRELIATKPASGGPFNILHLASGITRLREDQIREVLRSFHGEYQVPSGDELTDLLRDIFGNPFRPVAFDPAWRTDTAMSLARVMYETRDFTAMPILADALQDAGCEHADILDHCRGSGPHVRGCCVVDLVSGRE
jgi:hypothetical protein